MINSPLIYTFYYYITLNKFQCLFTDYTYQVFYKSNCRLLPDLDDLCNLFRVSQLSET